MSKVNLTAQMQEWQGDFGREYTDRNSFTPEEVDALWEKNYGVTRTEINSRFFQDIPKDARILEVGCNIGNQLVLLQRLGYSKLYGIELQSYALDRARAHTQGLTLVQSSAFDIPYNDGYFDLVFTAGVLIHIAPKDLAVALTEIHRCSRLLIFGAEYYSSEATEVNYRNKQSLLWKSDYALDYLSLFADLELVKEERLPYRENANVDSVFLLRKVS
jgi:pseudaminic acid biosynthesis-associated methylase